MCGRTSGHGQVWALGVRECSSPRHASCLHSSPRAWAPLTRAWARHLARGPDDMRVGSASHAHVERLTCVSRGLTRIFSGLRASSTRGLAPLCPDRRPPCPRQPIVGVFRRGGLHFGRHATSNRDLTASKRGNCSNRATTRRRHAGRMLLMVQNPHHYPWRHAPSLASCSLTSAGQPGGAPINAERASPTEPGQGNGRPAPRRRLWPMRRCAPIEKSQSQLIGRNAPSRVECSRSDAILQMGFIQSMALRRERASPMLLPQRCQGPSPDQHVVPHIHKLVTHPRNRHRASPRAHCGTLDEKISTR